MSVDVEQEQGLKRQELREQERKNKEELQRKVFNLRIYI